MQARFALPVARGSAITIQKRSHGRPGALSGVGRPFLPVDLTSGARGACFAVRITRIHPASAEELRDAVREEIESLAPGLRAIAGGVPISGLGSIDLLAADERGRLVLVLFSIEADPAAVSLALDQWDWAACNPGVLRGLVPPAGVDLSVPPRLMLVSGRLTESGRRLAAYIARPEIELFQATLLSAGSQRGALVERAVSMPTPLAGAAAGAESVLSCMPAGHARSLARRVLEELHDHRLGGEAVEPVGVPGAVDLQVAGRAIASIVPAGEGIEIRSFENVASRAVSSDADCRRAVSFLLDEHGRAAGDVAGGTSVPVTISGAQSRGAAQTAMAAAVTREEIAEFEKLDATSRLIRENGVSSGSPREGGSPGRARQGGDAEARPAPPRRVVFMEN